MNRNFLLVPTLGLTLTLGQLILPGSVRAQDPNVPVPPKPPKEVLIDERGSEGASWQADLRRAQAEAARAMRDVERQIGGMRFGFSGPDAQRMLVIPTTLSEEGVAQSQEDLAVMSTILNRAARPERNRKPDVLLELRDWRWGGGRDLDALLLEGYGAVFLLNVDFPLLAPAVPEEKPAEPKVAADNTWEKTRREVLGQPEDELLPDEEQPRPDRAYDANRVSELEQRLKEALRHAGNLRGLTSEDWIIVQVSGSGPARSVWKRTTGKGPEGPTRKLESARPGHSVLTLRVRKSAVDSLAAGKTQLEEFLRDVQITRRWEKPPAR